MQTFLPYPSFTESARCLDRKRLGKQRVEAKQIYLALTDPSCGWQHHPAVQMWRGHEGGLALYGHYICYEWKYQRGYQDTLQDWFIDRWPEEVQKWVDFDEPDIRKFLPPWLGDERVHSSHRANLLEKYPSWYEKFSWTETPTTGYYWPV